MMRELYFCMAMAIVFSGCSATAPSVHIDKTIPLHQDSSMLVITSPQQQYMPAAALNGWIDYDYLLDCTDDRCKIGKMHMLQYIDMPIASGEHTLYVRMSPDGLTSITAIINTDTLSIRFTASNNTRQFIAHDWELSLGSLIAPIAAPASKLTLVDDINGAKKLQTVIDTTSLFGDKMMGYGEKGTVYDK